MSMTICATREDMIRNLVREGMTGAEVGVRRGEFSLEFLKLPIAKIYLVDAWSDDVGEPAAAGEQEGNYQTCLRNLRGHAPGGRFEIVRGRSNDVARRWGAVKLDFVYIDACHEYESAMEDLIAWSGLLRRGGLIMGHDYTDKAPNAVKLKFGVVKAVTDFCRFNNWKLTHLTSEEYPSFCLQRGA